MSRFMRVAALAILLLVLFCSNQPSAITQPAEACNPFSKDNGCTSQIDWPFSLFNRNCRLSDCYKNGYPYGAHVSGNFPYCSCVFNDRGDIIRRFVTKKTYNRTQAKGECVRRNAGYLAAIRDKVQFDKLTSNYHGYSHHLALFIPSFCPYCYIDGEDRVEDDGTRSWRWTQGQTLRNREFARTEGTALVWHSSDFSWLFLKPALGIDHAVAIAHNDAVFVTGSTSSHCFYCVDWSPGNQN